MTEHSLPSTSDLAPRSRRPLVFAWSVVGLLTAAAIGAGVYAANLRLRANDVELRLVDAAMRMQQAEVRGGEAQAFADGLREHLTVLGARDLVAVALTAPGDGPAAGRLYVSVSGGIVLGDGGKPHARGAAILVSLQGLTPLPPGQIYQLWWQHTGAPASVGVIQPDVTGRATAEFDLPTGLTSPERVFVTVEPDGGAPAPTTTPVLTGTLRR